MRAELKPCPFCGSGNIILVDSITNFYIPIHYAICRDCECRGASKKSKEQAIEAWNRRVKDDE